MPLSLLQSRLRHAAQTTGLPLQVLEKDYALSYILAGMASNDQLAQTLILKGGTALKKLYFGDYRFSEDLDFSTIDAPHDEILEQYLSDAMQMESSTRTRLLRPLAHSRHFSR